MKVVLDTNIFISGIFWRGYSNKIIETALIGSADYVITQDKHLLNLNEYKNIKIIKPEEFLKIK